MSDSSATEDLFDTVRPELPTPSVAKEPKVLRPAAKLKAGQAQPEQGAVATTLRSEEHTSN
ncbi:MAG: hypothetical protein PHQ13_03700, partial [Rhodoferax sp.]|nr:hypothetical protein [Rhodoferax sp.]